MESSNLQCEHEWAAMGERGDWAQVCLKCGANRSDAPSKPKLLELFDNAAAFRQFEDYFVKNYPGPHTIINNPRWHAPKIWRAALYALGMNEKAASAPESRDD